MEGADHVSGPGGPARRAEPRGPRPLSRRTGLLVLLLLVLHAGLGLGSLLLEGISFDEPVHLIGGHLANVRGDYRLAENSHLPDRWAALPLLLLRPELPGPEDAAWRAGDVFGAAERVLWFGGREAMSLVIPGRIMILLLSVVLGGLVFAMALRLHGEAGALVALALYCASPNVLAHARLVTADLAAALLLLAGTWTTARLLERVDLPRLLTGCAVVSLLFVTKASSVALLPVAAILLGLRLSSRRPLRLAWGGRTTELPRPRAAAVLAAVVLLHALAAVAFTWTFYGMRWEAPAEPSGRAGLDARWERALEGERLSGRVLGQLRDSALLPEAFVFGHAHVAEHARRPAFLLGRWSQDGFLAYFPVTFLLKTPLSTLALLLLGAAAAVAAARAGRKREPPARGLATALIVLVLVYLGASLLARLSIGYRHVLPVLPPLFVLAGGAARWLAQPVPVLRGLARAALRGLARAALLGLALESALAWPAYLSYFNPLAGGADRAFRLVVDSTLDWGQDLPRLRRALAERGLSDSDAGPTYLAYFGSDDPFLAGIEAFELHSYRPWSHRHGRARGGLLGPGLYLVSATQFQGLNVKPLPPWTPEAEAEYQRLRAIVDPAFDPASPPALVQGLVSDMDWRGDYLLLDQRRLVRLCAWLRSERPEPDFMPTPCFLAWHLSEEDLRAALRGAPPLGF